MTKHTTHHMTIHHATTHKSKVTSAHRAHSKQLKTVPAIRRGIITSFNANGYTCGVLLLEATNTYLQNVPIAYHMDGTSALVNNFCVVLFFDEQNYTDAVILAMYPGAGSGAPIYPPGRMTFIPPFVFINNVTLTNGITTTYTLTGAHNLPIGTLGVFVQAHCTSASAGAYVTFWSHGGANNGFALGNLSAANGFVNGSGIVQLDANGRMDVTANGGDCGVFANVYGYIV